MKTAHGFLPFWPVSGLQQPASCLPAAPVARTVAEIEDGPAHLIEGGPS